MDQGQEPKSKFRIEVVASVIGAVFGVGSFAVAALSYIRPTDSAHPVHFDFLYRTVSFPLWAAGALILAVIAITAGFVRWTIKRPQTVEAPTSQKTAVLPVQRQIPPSARRLAESHPAINPVIQTHASGKNELTIPSPDDLLIHLRLEAFQEKKSCVLIVDNNRLDAISGASVTIYSAYSFDSNHREFRAVPSVSGIRMDQQDVIQPSCSGKPFLLVRKDPDKPHLFAGNNTSSQMIWPENDKSQIQKWKLSASFFAQTWPNNSTSMPKPLTVVKFDVIVTWDKAAAELLIEKG